MLGPLTELLAKSFEHFRRCGAGRRECVVFWTGPLDQPNSVDAVVHPHHSSGPTGYEIDVAWLKSFWLALYEKHRTVRVQAHIHPGTAFHSATDDGFAVSQRPGFLSLVVPDFAFGEVSLQDTALFELGDRGLWHQLDPLTSLGEAA
jgi:hypothetical protein